MMSKNTTTAAAILLSGILVALAIMYTQAYGEVEISANNENEFGNNNSVGVEDIRPIDSRDHVFGNQDAEVTIIEYSDFECPFCSKFHPTLEKIATEYDGRVKWVYRHFPLTNIHSRALGASVASECVAELSGNDEFWQFAKNAFNNQHNLGEDFYNKQATLFGIDPELFATCLSSNKYNELFSQELNNIRELGGTGTPFSIVINKNGETFPFSGALEYKTVKQIVEAALSS